MGLWKQVQRTGSVAQLANVGPILGLFAAIWVAAATHSSGYAELGQKPDLQHQPQTDDCDEEENIHHSPDPKRPS